MTADQLADWLESDWHMVQEDALRAAMTGYAELRSLRDGGPRSL